MGGLYVGGEDASTGYSCNSIAGSNLSLSSWDELLRWARRRRTISFVAVCGWRVEFEVKDDELFEVVFCGFLCIDGLEARGNAIAEMSK